MSLDRDVLRIAVIAVVAVVVARMFLPRVPIVGPAVAPYLG
jgi:hypothetical protein